MAVAAASNAIITTTDVKDFLSIASGTTTHDDYFQTWINYYSSLIEGINGINNKVKSQDISNEIGNGNGRSRYRPIYYPIVHAYLTTSTTDALKLACVQSRDDVDSDWENIEDDLDHILLNNPNLADISQQKSYNIELTEETFPEGIQNIRLNYQAGWSTIPADLAIVCLEMVCDHFKKSGKGDGRFGIQVKSKSEGGGSQSTTFIDFTDRHKKMMAPYKRQI
jgi:hypothetical protein